MKLMMTVTFLVMSYAQIASAKVLDCDFQEGRSRYVVGLEQNASGWVNYNHEMKSFYFYKLQNSQIETTEDNVKLDVEGENILILASLDKKQIQATRCITNHTRTPECGVPYLKTVYAGTVKVQRSVDRPFSYEGPAVCELR